MSYRSKHRLSQAGLRHLGESHEVGPYYRNGSETTQDVNTLRLSLLILVVLIKETQHSRTNRVKNSILHSTDNGVSQAYGRGALREDGKTRGEMGRRPSSLFSHCLGSSSIHAMGI